MSGSHLHIVASDDTPPERKYDLSTTRLSVLMASGPALLVVGYFIYDYFKEVIVTGCQGRIIVVGCQEYADNVSVALAVSSAMALFSGIAALVFLHSEGNRTSAEQERLDKSSEICSITSLMWCAAVACVVLVIQFHVGQPKLATTTSNNGPAIVYVAPLLHDGGQPIDQLLKASRMATDK